MKPKIYIFTRLSLSLPGVLLHPLTLFIIILYYNRFSLLEWSLRTSSLFVNKLYLLEMKMFITVHSLNKAYQKFNA